MYVYWNSSNQICQAIYDGKEIVINYEEKRIYSLLPKRKIYDIYKELRRYDERTRCWRPILKLVVKFYWNWRGISLSVTTVMPIDGWKIRRVG